MLCARVQEQDDIGTVEVLVQQAFGRKLQDTEEDVEGQSETIFEIRRWWIGVLAL